MRMVDLRSEARTW